MGEGLPKMWCMWCTKFVGDGLRLGRTKSAARRRAGRATAMCMELVGPLPGLGRGPRRTVASQTATIMGTAIRRALVCPTTLYLAAGSDRNGRCANLEGRPVYPRPPLNQGTETEAANGNGWRPGMRTSADRSLTMRRGSGQNAIANPRMGQRQRSPRRRSVFER